MIGDAIAAALPNLRGQAESLMTGACTFARESSTWDEGQQKTVTTWTTIHEDVPCAFDEPPATARVILTGDAVTPESPRVKIPVGYDGIEPDDRATVDGVGVMWVTHVPTRDNQVQVRIECRWTR